MGDLAELIQELQDASNGSQELNWKIAEILGEVPDHSVREVGWDYSWYRRPGAWTLWKATDSEGRLGTYWSPRAYTTNLQAASDHVVPDGMRWYASDTGAGVGFAGVKGKWWEHEHDEPALALCVASLKARQADSEKEAGG